MTAFLKSSAFATAVAAGVASGALSAAPARAAGAPPGTLRIGYGQACTRHSGTVAFVLENADRHRHTVSISGKGLTPIADAGTVPASRTVVVQFGIGAKGTTVSVSVDRGAPRTQRLKGCPRGDGDQGLIPAHPKKAADKPVAPPKQTHDHGTAPGQRRQHTTPRTPNHTTPSHIPDPAPRRNPDHSTSPGHGADHRSPAKRPTSPPPVNTA
jgi:hypothetical protein